MLLAVTTAVVLCTETYLQAISSFEISLLLAVLPPRSFCPSLHQNIKCHKTSNVTRHHQNTKTSQPSHITHNIHLDIIQSTPHRHTRHMMQAGFTYPTSIYQALRTRTNQRVYNIPGTAYLYHTYNTRRRARPKYHTQLAKMIYKTIFIELTADVFFFLSISTLRTL